MTDPRERILTCACELYLEDGFDGFSMRKLARAVGVTAPALYRHYESREKVLLDVVGEAQKILAHYLYRSLSAPTPEERFQRAGDAYLEFALDHPRYFQMIYSFAEFMGLDELPEELCEQGGAIHRFWDDRVRECVEAGILRPAASERIGLTLWAHGYGLISLYLRGMLPVPEDAFRGMYRDSFGRILAGLAEDPFARRIREKQADEDGTAAAGAGAAQTDRDGTGAADGTGAGRIDASGAGKAGAGRGDATGADEAGPGRAAQAPTGTE